MAHEINKRIWELRKHLGMSRQAFGEKVGVSESVIKNIEYELTDPKPFFIKQICSTYKVNEDWLQSGEGEMMILTTTENALIEVFADLIRDSGKSFKKDFIVNLAKALSQLTDEQWDGVETFIVELAQKSNKKDG